MSINIMINKNIGITIVFDNVTDKHAEFTMIVNTGYQHSAWSSSWGMSASLTSSTSTSPTSMSPKHRHYNDCQRHHHSLSSAVTSPICLSSNENWQDDHLMNNWTCKQTLWWECNYILPNVTAWIWHVSHIDRCQGYCHQAKLVTTNQIKIKRHDWFHGTSSLQARIS